MLIVLCENERIKATCAVLFSGNPSRCVDAAPIIKKWFKGACGEWLFAKEVNWDLLKYYGWTFKRGESHA